METQLLEITGLDPSDANYAFLRTGTGRNNYLNAIQEKYDSLINNNIYSVAIEGGELADGSLMSIQTLRLIQALREIVAANARIWAFSERIEIEKASNKDLNDELKDFGNLIALIDAAVALSKAVEVSICAVDTVDDSRVDTR